MIILFMYFGADGIIMNSVFFIINTNIVQEYLCEHQQPTVRSTSDLQLLDLADSHSVKQWTHTMGNNKDQTPRTVLSF